MQENNLRKLAKFSFWFGCVISAILLPASCKNKSINTNTTNVSAKEIIQSAIEESNNKVTAEESAPLIIGGRQYRGQLGERVEVEKGSWRIPNDPVNCTVNDIDKLFIMTLWIDPEDPERRNSLENLELLYNLKELDIEGKNLDKVDFSPISSLLNLEELEIEGNITRLPDMKKLERLKTVVIKKGSLESLEGLGGDSIERISIHTYETDNSTLRINDTNNMLELRRFGFEGGKINLHGIDRFTSLEVLSFRDCEPFNLEGIGYLINLKILDINITSPTPSIEFISNLKNLEHVELFGNGHLYNYRFPFEYTTELLECEATQILDVSPLAVLLKPSSIICRNFIIKNVSALDALDLDSPIDLMGSRLYDKTEKSKHHLVFKLEGDR